MLQVARKITNNQSGCRTSVTIPAGPARGLFPGESPFIRMSVPVNVVLKRVANRDKCVRVYVRTFLFGRPALTAIFTTDRARRVLCGRAD